MLRKIFLFSILIFASCSSSKVVTRQKSSAYFKNFHEGVRCQLSGDYQKAIEAFEKALNEESNDDAAAYGISICLEKQLQPSAALVYLKRASESDPKNNYYRTQLARLFQVSGEFLKAAKLQETLLKTFPEDEQLYFDAAMNYASAKDATSALKILDKLSNKYGNSPDLVIYQYNILLKADPSSSKGVDLLEKANKDFPNNPGVLSYLIDHYMARGNFSRGTELLEKLVAADPSNALANILLGDIYNEAGDKKNAFNFYKQAIKGDGLSSKTITETFIKMKDVWVTDNEIGNLLINCAINFPKDPFISSLLGDYYYQHKDIPQTIFYYKKAVELNPNLNAIWNELLLLEFEINDWQSLKDDGKKVIELYPLSPLGFYMAGTALNRLGEYQSAKSIIEDGLSIIVNDDQLKGEFTAQLAEAYMGLKEITRGINYFDEALKFSPNNSYILNRYFINTIYKIKDPKKAFQLHEIIEKSEANDNRRKERIAHLYFLEKKYEEAYLMLESIDSLYAHFNDVLELQGDVLYFLKKPLEAIKKWQNVKLLGKKSIILEQKITTGTYHDPL